MFTSVSHYMARPVKARQQFCMSAMNRASYCSEMSGQTRKTSERGGPLRLRCSIT